MLAPVEAFVNAVITGLGGNLTIGLITLAFIIIGCVFLFGNHEHAKSRATWAFVGAFALIGAKSIATAMSSGIPH